MRNTIAKRIAAIEQDHKRRRPIDARTKAERDAQVAEILADPVQVRGIMSRLVGEGQAEGRTLAFMSRRAAITAAMRADT